MRNYLVASDLSERSDPALDRAVDLMRQARAAGETAAITLLHVLDRDASHHPDAARALRDRIAALPERDAIRCLALPGDADETILSVAQDSGAALILMGIPRPRRFLQGLAGTTAERVLSDSRQPVAVIRRPGLAPWRRVLLASDQDAAALGVVQAMQALGLLQGTDLTVLHATNLPGPPQMRTGGMSSVDLQRLDMHAMAELEHRLRRRLRDRLGAAEHLDFALRHGSAPAAILDLQGRGHFDLVVMGARGQGALLRRVLGSTSAEMIRQIDTDLLCVPLAPE